MRRRVFRSLWLVPLAAGCSTWPETVLVEGTVFDEAYGEGEPVAELTVLSRNAAFEEHATTTTDADGRFSLEVAAVQDLYLEISGEEHATTLFAGEAGLVDMEVTDGTLWVRSADASEELAETFGDCAAGLEGGIIEGEVRAWIEGDLEMDDLPLVETASLTVYDANGIEYAPCFLDADGEPDDDATVTNATGRFAFFGLPAGPLTVEVTYGDATEEELGVWWYYHVYMVEDGISPFYPLLVELVDT